MRARKRGAEEGEFQMAPMIDMVFLLLVFFMCVSTLEQADRAVPLSLPESKESKVPDDLSDRGTVSIDHKGVIYLGRKKVDIEKMKKQIGLFLREKPDLQIHLRADRETAYGDIKRVLQSCAEAGAYKIIYATHQSK